MKLTHITMHYCPMMGGQEVYIHSLNNILAKRNIQIDVIQPSRKKATQKPSNVYYLPRPRFISRFINIMCGDSEWFWFNFMLCLNRKKLKSSDILTCHYPFHYPSIKWHQRVIVVSHGMDWTNPVKSLFDKYKKYAAFLCKQNTRNNVTIVANDTHFLRSIGYDIQPGERYFQEIEHNVWFIPNCINTRNFDTRKSTRENIILVPRNIRKSRGIHRAIEAFNLFCKSDSDFEMHIAGEPLRGSYYEFCVQRLKEYGIQNRVHFLGSIDNQKMGMLYNKAKLTLIPTLGFEGTSLSALEAMACGCPVVSTEVGGLKDLPTFKSGAEPEELCKSMRLALDKSNELAAEQYGKVRAVFSLENWARTWCSVLYRQL